LVQLPGIGLITAMVILAAVGDISRFEHAKNLTGYAGLGTFVHDSGQTHRHGGISKYILSEAEGRGRADLRQAMVEAAWVAARTHPRWKAEYERLAKYTLSKVEGRMPANKAIVAVARKLLVVVWHVLHDHEADRNAQPDKCLS
jgi:transposase